MRIVLLGALGVVAYLLVLAWNEDYGGPPQRSADEALRDPLADSTTPVDVPAATTLPDIPGPAPGSDLPSVTALEEVLNRSPSSSELIRVSTDVLNVWIDTRGGDIVKVNLPGYPVSLDTPDVPLVLLDRSASHIYIAQSGLVGPRGPDEKNCTRPA